MGDKINTENEIVNDNKLVRSEDDNSMTEVETRKATLCKLGLDMKENFNTKVKFI